MWHTWRGDSGYIPGLSLDGHCYSRMRGYSDKGGGGGWTSLDYPWMVTVTLASADTLTWGGRVDIPGLSMDGHSYSQLSTKQLCPSMDGRGLSTAPLDISDNMPLMINVNRFDCTQSVPCVGC